MKIRIDGSKLGRKDCFDYGQKVTEVGAGLAYAEHQIRRVSAVGRRALEDVSAGLHTASKAANGLQKDLKGRNKARAAGLAREIGSFNDRLRTWIQDPARRVTIGDVSEIQKEASSLRRKVTDLWNQMRRTCT